MEGVELAALAERVRAGDMAADRELTLLAASGDLGAQRELLTVVLGWSDGCPQTFEQAIRLEVLARFCAIRGNAADAARHAMILWAAAKYGRERGDDPSAVSSVAHECAGIIFRLVEAAWGPAIDNLSGFAAEFPEEWAAVEAEAKAAPVKDCPIVGETIGDLLASSFAKAMGRTK